ncbi:hypothetical protein HZA86_01125 [Candidatus Uhrbacteria bacterium]|nr:hypothetical protein [Candidatus Uhrbacteria bacterium]
METKTVLNVKIDKVLKTKAQRLAHDVGVPLSIIVNAQLKQFVREKRLTLGEPFTMSEELERALGPIDRDIKKGRNMSKGFTDVNKMIEYLKQK